jgi:heme-degrading monooxygenase HmoA
MITVANRIYVAPEFADAFEERFRKRAGLVDGMPGFVSNQVLRPVNDGDPYVVFTIWNSRDDFLSWVRSDEFVKGHAQSGTMPKEAFTGPNKLEVHEVLQDSARPDLAPEPKGGPLKIRVSCLLLFGQKRPTKSHEMARTNYFHFCEFVDRS